MSRLYRSSLRCILFPEEQAGDPTFGFIMLILVALPLYTGGLLTAGHAAAVAGSVTAVLAMAASAVRESATMATTAAAEMVRRIAAARVAIPPR